MSTNTYVLLDGQHYEANVDGSITGYKKGDTLIADDEIILRHPNKFQVTVLPAVKPSVIKPSNPSLSKH